VILAFVLVTSLTSLMNLAFIRTNVQNTLVGVLMIGAVAVPAIVTQVRLRLRQPLESRTNSMVAAPRTPTERKQNAHQS
jgi:hypothetical protein